MAGPLSGDLWRQERDRSNDPKREPGPIELNRYVATPGAYAGIATFMGLPLAIYPEDLKAGEVDVAVMGAPIDLSGGRRVLGTALPTHGGAVHSPMRGDQAALGPEPHHGQAGRGVDRG